MFNLLKAQFLAQLSGPHCASVTGCQLVWMAFYFYTLVLNGSKSSLGRSRYPANPRHPKALFTQARAFELSQGVAAALACKYVNNAFGCVDGLVFPILPVKRRDPGSYSGKTIIKVHRII